MPGDVLGTNLFNFQTNSFILTKGPIFTQLLLADEINRTPPKTQAALLQAMNERIVTIDGKDYRARRRFHGGGDAKSDRAARHLSAARSAARPLPVQDQSSIIRAATRNARSCAGTAIARPCRGSRISTSSRSPTARRLPRCARPSTYVRLSDPLIDYIVDVIRATREHSSLEVGASTRAANMLASAARAFAVLQGREFRHSGRHQDPRAAGAAPRVTMSPSAEIEGLTTDRILREVLDQTPAPR